MTDTPSTRALRTIERCNDPTSLRQIAKNSRAKGELEVARSADLRLYSVLPAADPQTLEYDIWRSIYALEGTLSEERGKTIRLGRTRQSITGVGELEAITKLILRQTPSDGYFMLIERDMADLTFEAVALRHPDRFDDDVLQAATKRLETVAAEARV